MAEIVDFLTSEGGIFAAIVALLGAAALVATLVRPMVTARRAAEEATPRLDLSDVRVSDPPPHSEAGEATFQLVNTGGGKAVLRDLLLIVEEHGPVEIPKMIDAAAPVPEFSYTVVLDPDTVEYDVRRRAFGSPPPHSYEGEEIESFLVELRSTTPQWYRFHFSFRWYDARSPEQVEEIESSALRIEFRPSALDVLASGSD